MSDIGPPIEAERRFAERLRMVRLAHHWSTAKLAEISGIPRIAISRIELGQRGVSLGEALKLAEAIGVSLERLVKEGGFAAHATIVIEEDA